MVDRQNGADQEPSCGTATGSEVNVMHTYPAHQKITHLCANTNSCHKETIDREQPPAIQSDWRRGWGGEGGRRSRGSSHNCQRVCLRATLVMFDERTNRHKWAFKNIFYSINSIICGANENMYCKCVCFNCFDCCSCSATDFPSFPIAASVP